jgi:hypothetical protein
VASISNRALINTNQVDFPQIVTVNTNILGLSAITAPLTFTLADVSRPTIEKMESDGPARPDLASAVCRVLSEKLGYEVTIESAEIKVL